MWKRVSFRNSCRKFFKGVLFETNILQGLLKRNMKKIQPKQYRDEVLPPGITTRVSIEAGVTIGWHKYVGRECGNHWHRSLWSLGARENPP